LARTAIIITILTLFQGCVTDDKTPSKEIVGNTFKQNDLKFSIDLPAGWQNTMDEQTGGIKTEVISRNVEQGNFRANIVVAATPGSGTQSMSDVLSFYKSETIKVFPGFQFLLDTVLIIDNVEVGKVIYKGNMFGLDLKFKELLFMRSNSDVQIIFTDLELYFDNRVEFINTESSLKFF
jgi:hypothetical protein